MIISLYEHRDNQLAAACISVASYISKNMHVHSKFIAMIFTSNYIITKSFALVLVKETNQTNTESANVYAT